MNSLLQTLFMTREFTARLFRWRHNASRDGPRETSIAYQLQALFARLAHSRRRAVATTKLTASFGWTSSDAFTQHDVQELNRVLFDALEETFEGSDADGVINTLYQGKFFFFFFSFFFPHLISHFFFLFFFLDLATFRGGSFPITDLSLTISKLL
jgi:hypothetical protein